MTDYEFDQSPDPSPRSRPMAERDLSPHGQRIVSKLERIMLRNARDGRATMDGDFAGIPAADVARYQPLARARVNRQVFRQDDLDTALSDDLSDSGNDETRIAGIMLEAASSLLPSDAAILRRAADIGVGPDEAAAHLAVVKAGLARHIAAEGVRHG